MYQAHELEQNRVTEQGSPQGWPAATGTLYAMYKKHWKHLSHVGATSHSRRGVAGEDGARGMAWAADPWLVSVT